MEIILYNNELSLERLFSMLTDFFAIKSSQEVIRLFGNHPNVDTILYIYPNDFNSGLSLGQAFPKKQ